MCVQRYLECTYLCDRRPSTHLSMTDENKMLNKKTSNIVFTRDDTMLK